MGKKKSGKHALEVREGADFGIRIEDYKMKQLITITCTVWVSVILN